MRPDTRDMPPPQEPKAPVKRTASGVEPLRRKRAQPVPATPAPGRRKVLNVLLGFATLVLLIDALVGEQGLMERLRAREQYAAQAAAVDALKAENARLLEESRRLRDDPWAVEAIARKEFGLIRPGERLFILRDVTPTRTAEPR